MNLHDWIDELCDLLDIEAEADEALLGDLAGITADNVHASAGPVTAYLLGLAAAEHGTDPDQVEQLAARVQGLAEAWDRPAGAVDETEQDLEADQLTDLAVADGIEVSDDDLEDEDRDDLDDAEEEEALV